MNVNDKIYNEIIKDMIEQGQTFDDVKKSGIYDKNLLMSLEATLITEFKKIELEYKKYAKLLNKEC